MLVNIRGRWRASMQAVVLLFDVKRRKGAAPGEDGSAETGDDGESATSAVAAAVDALNAVKVSGRSEMAREMTEGNVKRSSTAASRPLAVKMEPSRFHVNMLSRNMETLQNIATQFLKKGNCKY